MFAYRTPGVYYEDADNRTASLGLSAHGHCRLRRNRQAGADSPSGQGAKLDAVRQPLRAHAAQAYLAYAVEGFFSNGGDTCWVVRVADPDLARPSRAVLYDTIGRPAVRLSAACRIDHSGSFRSVLTSNTAKPPGQDPANDIELDPGVWGDGITVTVRASGLGRFTLTVACPGEPTEVYRDVVLDPADDRDAVKVLNAIPPLPASGRNGSGRRGRRRVLSPARASSPRLTSAHPRSILPQSHLSRLSHSFRAAATGLPRHSSWPTPAAPNASAWLRPRRPLGRTIQVTVIGDSVASHFGLTLDDTGSPERYSESWTGLSLDPSDSKYVVAILNNRWKGAPDGGSRLVSARDLTPPDLQASVPLPFSIDDIRVHRPPVPGKFVLSGGLNPSHLSAAGDPLGRQLGLSTLELIDEVSTVAMPDLAPPQPPPARVVKPRPVRCDGPQAATVPPPRVPEAPQETAPVFSADQVTALRDCAGAPRCPPSRPRRADRPARAGRRSCRAFEVDRNRSGRRRPGNSACARLARRPADRLELCGTLLSMALGGRPSWARRFGAPVPPCGHVAGIFARTDRDFGVHKPPANTEVEGA